MKNNNQKFSGKFGTHKHEIVMKNNKQTSSTSEEGYSFWFQFCKRINTQWAYSSPARYDPVENRQPGFQQQVEKQGGPHRHAKAPS